MMDSDQAAKLADLGRKVQTLANQVHQAKIKLDQSLWGPGGLPTNPQALSRTMANLRKARGPNSVTDSLKEAQLLDLAYRNLRGQWLLAKSELDSLKSNKQVSESVAAARRNLESKFKPELLRQTNHIKTTNRAYFPAEDPELMKNVADAVRQAVQQAENERSIGSVAALVETLAVAQVTGFDSKSPGVVDNAFKKASVIAEEIAHEAYRKYKMNPNNKILKDTAVKTAIYSQMLGGSSSDIGIDP